jgi:hypothetical protein
MKIPPNRILFQEAQYFRSTWVWTSLIISSIFSIVLVSVLLLADQESDNNYWITLSIVGGINAINLTIFYLLGFEYIVTETGIYYKWKPFHFKYKHIPKEWIIKFYYRKWDRMQWGYTKRKDWGSCHTINGNHGIQLELNNRKWMYIGTQKRQQLENALEKMIAHS